MSADVTVGQSNRSLQMKVALRLDGRGERIFFSFQVVKKKMTIIDSKQSSTNKSKCNCSRSHGTRFHCLCTLHHLMETSADCNCILSKFYRFLFYFVEKRYWEHNKSENWRKKVHQSSKHICLSGVNKARASLGNLYFHLLYSHSSMAPRFQGILEGGVSPDCL